MAAFLSLFTSVISSVKSSSDKPNYTMGLQWLMKRQSVKPNYTIGLQWLMKRQSVTYSTDDTDNIKTNLVVSSACTVDK